MTTPAGAPRRKEKVNNMLWNKEIPTEEGWYFWCERKVKDPFYWHTYYVALTDLDLYLDGLFDRAGAIPAVTFWENGVEVHPPEKGFWKIISF